MSCCLWSPSFWSTQTVSSHILFTWTRKVTSLSHTPNTSSLPEKNTAISEDLASHGYIVCSGYHRDFDKHWPGPVHRRQSELRAALDMLEQMNDNDELEVAPHVIPGEGLDPKKKGY